MTGLTKTRTVMTRLDSDNQLAERSVTFVRAYDDTGVITRTVLLSHDDWVDLGSPDEITVTIEPGDHLNPD